MRSLDVLACLLLPALMCVCISVRALTDPTRPYGYGEKPEFVEVEIPEESTDWHLNGIRIEGENRRAILNGMMVREGEMIEKARVLTINQTSIVLEQGDKHLVIKMLDAKVKKPARMDAQQMKSNSEKQDLHNDK